jgi:glucose/arabinose dehydrogenase
MLLGLGAGAADAASNGGRLVPVAGGFDRPLLVTAPPGDTRRLFVVEQPGRILILKDGRRLKRPFLDVSRLVSGGFEQGLLGLAFHPGYARNGRFFIDYTDRAGNSRVVEYRVSGDPDRANARPVRRLLFVPQPYPNHNGGQLAFGPDGKLYIGLGDGGSAGDPQGNGQRLDTLLGKILRIDVDARPRGRPFAIPADNPFVGRRGTRPAIYVLGLRNPWRFSFDRANGDLWIGDVGQNAWEEVDRLPAGSIAGANLGWNAFEGTHPFGGPLGVGPAVQPVAQYPHSTGCSVTGGFVYRGSAVPALTGRYVYADYCSGRVWTMRAGPSPGDVRDITRLLGARVGQVTSFGEDARGELYLVAGARVYRFRS